MTVRAAMAAAAGSTSLYSQIGTRRSRVSRRRSAAEPRRVQHRQRVRRGALDEPQAQPGRSPLSSGPGQSLVGREVQVSVTARTQLLVECLEVAHAD
jgi:hypothetical protein